MTGEAFPDQIAVFARVGFGIRFAARRAFLRCRRDAVVMVSKFVRQDVEKLIGARRVLRPFAEHEIAVLIAFRFAGHADLFPDVAVRLVMIERGFPP